MITYNELASTQTIDKPQLVTWRPSASIRRSVMPWTWVYMLFRRSHSVSRLIAADACAYVCRMPGRIDRAAGSGLASRLQTVTILIWRASRVIHDLKALALAFPSTLEPLPQSLSF
jgi:hypothetical protein